MRYLTLFLLGIFSINQINSQIYEIGVFAGGSNVIGDVGSTTYINPNSPALGLLLKWNRSPRHAWRVSLTYADITGDDSKSNDPRRIERDYRFDNNLFEISAGMEFTFFDFNLHELEFKGTPYLYSGISIANHNNYFFSSSGAYTDENTSSWAYGIPIVLGYKTRLMDHFIIAAEVGARYTFSDEIDGSVPDSEERQSLSFGNINSKDWYVFSGFTLTYTFGRQPCYCNF